MTDLESMLADLFERRVADKNVYDINVALKLKPWVRPAESLWSDHLEGLTMRNRWEEDALKVLQDFHDDYKQSRAEV